MHWLDNIITPSVRPKTAARYRTDVVEYLVPGLGAQGPGIVDVAVM
jgi:hypothetical protein